MSEDIRGFNIKGKSVNLWYSGIPAAALPIVYLPVFEGDGADIWTACRELKCPAFTLVTISGLDWNRELSPWPCDAITATSEPFAGRAEDFLDELTHKIIPSVEASFSAPPRLRTIAGYSLAGLFALWACCQTDLFNRAASVSGSLWFPGFAEYLDENLPQDALDVAYLSLGKKEHKTPNRMMREVLTDTKRCEQILQDRGAKTLFEHNPGNHFSEPVLRSARGIAWMLER